MFFSTPRATELVWGCFDRKLENLFVSLLGLKTVGTGPPGRFISRLDLVESHLF